MGTLGTNGLDLAAGVDEQNLGSFNALNFDLLLVTRSE